MCSHKFIVPDISATSKFLCRECDTRFIDHPDVINPDVIDPAWPFSQSLRLNDHISILDGDMWYRSKVVDDTYKDLGWVSVYHAERDYKLDVKIQHLKLGTLFSYPNVWQYRHLHKTHCMPSLCYFGSRKCPIKS